jgi:hypothetical protein
VCSSAASRTPAVPIAPVRVTYTSTMNSDTLTTLRTTAPGRNHGNLTGYDS